MKCSVKWIYTWVKTDVSPAVLGDVLTAGGLELESLTSVGDDAWIELGVTPNRGDCLSVEGIGREAAALLDAPFIPLKIETVAATTEDSWPIIIEDKASCLRYFSRRIKQMNAALQTPEWITERLQSTGMRSVSLVVDLANYVMMELGQPLHTFDVSTLEGAVCVRQSRGETITLIDNSTVTLDNQTCVIADEKKVLAIAGVMGCLDSSVTVDTKEILIESAFFLPAAIRGKARQYKLNSDGAVRWERGVDPTLAGRAMERLTALILSYAEGAAGPVLRIEVAPVPTPASILLPMHMIQSRLGIKIEPAFVATLLKRLHMQCQIKGDSVAVVPPVFRFDIQIPEDLLEEVARVYGYDHIPETLPPIVPGPTPCESTIPLRRLKDMLVDRDYQEVITYSFVDEALQQALFPSVTPIKLLNPLSPDMAVMRHSLLLGLLQTAAYNQARQTLSMRLFEVGQCFSGGLPDVRFEEHLGMLVCGQTSGFWQQQKPRPYDFYDLKGDVEALLGLTYKSYHFVPTDHPVLAPGQSAAVIQGGHTIGILGALHPRLLRPLDLRGPVFVCELSRDALLSREPLSFKEGSKFPAIRRDLAIVVDAALTADEMMAKVREKGGEILTHVEIFDVYQGEHLEKSKKSVALGLILQHSSRTLIEDEVNASMLAIIHGLKQAFGAIVRE